MIKLSMLSLLLLSAKNVFADCINPVPNEYIIVTKYPDKVLQLSAVNFKTSNQNNSFIYDHRSLNLSFKSSIKPINNLEASTLILSLSEKMVNEISTLADTSLTQNCFVDLETSPLANTVIENDDPYFSRQWGLSYFLQNISEYKSLKKIKVAVSDTGFDIDHEDLKSNLSVNLAELNGLPNFDDDNNGCIDDIYGCDVTQQNGEVGINTYKSNLIDHGTHVAGIIAANTNNQIGVSGAGFNVELLLVKTFSSHRKTTGADLIKSIYYAVNNKAEVINCSWGTGTRPTLAEFNAFEFARINNVIVVTAAGNSATYAATTSPAGLSNVLTVGSFNSSLQLSTFSNFGEAVDILAPGGDGIERKNDGILSLITYSRYSEKKGTSMAAPFITAALANLKSLFPDLKRTELVNILLKSSDIKSVQGFFDTSYKDDLKFINMANAIALAEDYVTRNQNNPTDINEYDFEPKKIVKPSSQGSLSSSSSSDNLTNDSQSSGCNHSAQQKSASNQSWLLLLIPLLYLGIKKRTLKKDPL
jgi:subtilisin family serine protease